MIQQRIYRPQDLEMRQNLKIEAIQEKLILTTILSFAKKMDVMILIFNLFCLYIVAAFFFLKFYLFVCSRDWHSLLAKLKMRENGRILVKRQFKKKSSPRLPVNGILCSLRSNDSDFQMIILFWIITIIVKLVIIIVEWIRFSCYKTLYNCSSLRPRKESFPHYFNDLHFTFSKTYLYFFSILWHKTGR